MPNYYISSRSGTNPDDKSACAEMLSIQQAITSVYNTPLPYGIFKLLQTNTYRVVVTQYTIEPNILFSMGTVKLKTKC